MPLTDDRGLYTTYLKTWGKVKSGASVAQQIDAADWQETAATIFGIDVSAEPDRAKAMHESHLARARWMTEIGYAHLLGCERRLNR